MEQASGGGADEQFADSRRGEQAPIGRPDRLRLVEIVVGETPQP